ncbi:osiris-like protein [Asbolus verrucosus]|uniref:Osiris-like protein n=1 Tax=Asbolus verrucosus TaxID=1661398 RepID=A0A482VD79_ASBVE|nr:osiris-like protein [Asbolus verrucosus]
MLLKCVIIFWAAATAWGRTTPLQNSIHEETPRSQDSSYFSDLNYVYKVYQECAAKDLAPCLKLKLISAIDRVARNYAELSIFDGIAFVKDPKASVNEIKTEEEIEATLPRALNERDTALNTIITDKITNFFDTHTLQVKLPSASEIQRSFSEEGRKKGGKKGSGLLILPLILGGTLIPLALGALALLAGKALIVSKLALVLAAIIGIKKLLSGSSGGHDSGHEVVVSGGHGSGWGRSYDKEQAQKLAYSAYAPKTT